MLIRIESPEKNLTLRIPTSILLNQLVAGIASRYIARNGLAIPAPILKNTFDIVKKYKKRHPDWTLVEVRSADGEYILIKF